MRRVLIALVALLGVVLEAQGVAINGTVAANGTNLPSGVSGGFVNQYANEPTRQP
ncbi:MAG TPA: hypothetical protein VK737_09320 [Opitutales bacterium]|jgi:hypothetical protein|nr:hypothetical protein [Opitutales bacterium]